MSTQRRDPVVAPAAGRLLSLKTLEARSEVKEATWRLWARQGRLPCVRLGRRLLIAEADYDRFVEQNRAKAPVMER